MVPTTVEVPAPAPVPGLGTAEAGSQLQSPPAGHSGGGGVVVGVSGAPDAVKVWRAGDKVEVNYGSKGEYYPGVIDKVGVIDS